MVNRLDLDEQSIGICMLEIISSVKLACPALIFLVMKMTDNSFLEKLSDCNSAGHCLDKQGDCVGPMLNK